MTTQQIDELAEQIGADIKTGLDITAIFVPETIPLVIIGRAVERLVPGLSKTVARWVAGNPPTDEELAELKSQLAVLADPDNP